MSNEFEIIKEWIYNFFHLPETTQTGLQTIILAITALIVWRYTKQTKLLRKETQKQTDQMIQPCLFLHMNEEPPHNFDIRCLNDNVALNIKLMPIPVKENGNKSSIIKQKKKIDYINKKSSLPLRLARYEYDNTLKKYIEVDGAHITQSHPLAKGEWSEVSVSYYNIKMQKYIMNGTISIKGFKIKNIKKAKDQK